MGGRSGVRRGMGRVKKRAKDWSRIGCLESFWTYEAENQKRVSVLPLLEVLSKRDSVRYVLLTSSTVEELRLNLDILKQMRWGVVYFAMHGYAGGVKLLNLKVDLESLAALMRKDFKNRIVIFSSCSTLKIEKTRIRKFMDDTGIAMLVGFKKRVDWIDGAAIDLLFLDWIQFYVDLKKCWNRFRMGYGELISMTGMEVYHR